jgi:hypothetical protein
MHLFSIEFLAGSRKFSELAQKTDDVQQVIEISVVRWVSDKITLFDQQYYALVRGQSSQSAARRPIFRRFAATNRHVCRAL